MPLTDDAARRLLDSIGRGEPTMRDRIGNALVRLGMRVRRTKRYNGGTIPAPPKDGGIPVRLSSGVVLHADVEEFRRGMRRAGGAL